MNATGENHRKGSSEGDSFFEELAAYERSKEKENRVMNRFTTKDRLDNTLSSQSETIFAPVKNAPETKTPTPVKKVVRDPPMKNTSRSLYMTPGPGRKDVSPQSIPPRPWTELKFYQRLTPAPSNEQKIRPPSESPAHLSPSVDSNSSDDARIHSDKARDSPMKSASRSSYVTPSPGWRNASPQNIPPRPWTEPKSYQKPTSVPSVEERFKPPSQSPKKIGPRLDINSSVQSPLLSDKVREGHLSKNDEVCTSLFLALSFYSVKPISSKILERIIIIDIGHYYVRAGALRDGGTNPDLCLPNIFGVTSTGVLFGDAVPRITDAEFVKSRLNLYEYGKSFKVKSVNSLILHLCHGITMLVSTIHQQLLLCLPTRASALRPYFIDYFLGPTAATDGFGIVEAVATVSAFRAALQTPKVSTCLVISLSADLEIIPLAEGGLVEHGRSTTALYGEEALRSFMKEMVAANIELSEQEFECFGHYIYQQAAFIENKETRCHDVVIDLSQYAPYPINKRISVPAELRLKASDALLRPEQACTYNGELPSFKELLNRTIQSCDVDLRSAICSNVLLIGEFAGIEGLRERMSEEMRAFLPEGASPPTVQVAMNSAGLAYEGACLLSTVLQGPQPPRCPWFRFIDAKAWSSMRLETGCSTSFSGTRLLSRLNRDCLWP
ncbi:unnamed protein product [Hydatigera taeniaeformis]|uniref:Actin-like ATPase domain-containing protein n=1 Tax=Hydatigena taeniaeformis TaxID=6205 RepID=A0A0R3X3E5_HYDTA|nr:unnamed protein product [Hydatigera taeniaeformis]